MSTPVIVPASSWRRQQWKSLARITTPTPENWGHHSGGGSKTLAVLRGNERYHVQDLGWRAIGYSFAIVVSRIDHGFGRIYVCRGWGREGGHTRGRNTRSHGVLLVGNWASAAPAEIEAASRSFAWLILDGARRGQTVAVVSGGHLEAPGASTACPAAAGMRVVARARQLVRSGEVSGDYELGDRILTTGHEGPDVETLQRLLNWVIREHRSNRALLDDDGIFGPLTAAEVVFWGRRGGLSFPDPKRPRVGPKTVETLRRLRNEARNAPDDEDDMAELSEEAQRFYEKMYREGQKIPAEDSEDVDPATPTSLWWVLRDFRARRRFFTRNRLG